MESSGSSTSPPKNDQATNVKANASPEKGRETSRKRKRNSQKKGDEATVSGNAKYTREGPKLPLHRVKDKKIRSKMKKAQQFAKEAAEKAARAELLLPMQTGLLESADPQLCPTKRFSQKDISENVDVQSSHNRFDLDMPTFGPYKIDYSRDGRYLLMGGKKGHLGMIDWKKNKLTTEVHAKETVRDVKILHNFELFAAAQKKYVFFYDRQGIETHCLKSHTRINRLEYLPYHWLLASIGETGYLKYQDTSTGALVAELPTRHGNCDCMVQNPWNAIINLGHYNGTVTMWSPNMTKPLIKMLCHNGPVKAIAIDRMGQYMASSGNDGRLKIWDLRTYKLFHEYHSIAPASCLSISQTGLLGVGWGPHVTIWKDVFVKKQKDPYMQHMIPGAEVFDLGFGPYEDVLGIGHSKGVSSIIVPGSGEANFDSFEANPYQSTKQRREAAVHSLLEKLKPEMITLDPFFVGKVDRAPRELILKERAEEHVSEESKDVKNRTRGKDKKKRHKKKQKNVIAEQRTAREDEHLRIKEQVEERKKRSEEKAAARALSNAPPAPALDRFRRRR